MARITLKELAKRVDELERKLADRSEAAARDWRLVAGMFSGNACSRQIDQEARKIREADREAARREFGE
jgi:hypothetical protein